MISGTFSLQIILARRVLSHELIIPVGTPAVAAGHKDTMRLGGEQRMESEFRSRVGMFCAALALTAISGATVADEVADRAKDPNQWAAPGGDQANTRHSNLKDITTANVGKLQMIWSQSSGTLRGHEGQPLVVTVDGKLVFATLDGFVVALDAKTGKEDWVVKSAYPDRGETITPAPIIANGKVIIGFGGDEFAARGRLDAYALADGKKVWEFFSTGSDKDVGLTPNTNKAHPEYGTAGSDVGIHSYPGDEWKRGGGALWGFYSYDPELKLVYTSTGNPGLWSPS